MASSIKIGIIGGTGLDKNDFIEDRSEVKFTTPFGEPSAPLVCGKIKGVDCVLLARHGVAHEIMPSHVNFRANLYALRSVGCTHVVATTATGSLREEIAPGHFVILDQFIDMTKQRVQTYYDNSQDEFKGICHLPMADPFCPHMRKILASSVEELGLPHHQKGTVVTVEGPRFSTRAESHMWRLFGADVINMTSCPEVTLANELGLCYASVAMATDYDCWREGEEAVTAEMVFATLRANADKATQVLLHAIPRIAQHSWDVILKEKQASVRGSVIGV